GRVFSPVGVGLDSPATTWTDGTVSTLAVLDEPSGRVLYAGGRFATSGGASASHVARWDGRAWTDVSGGTDGTVVALTPFDDGTGPALYAGGAFPTAGGVPAARIAKWDGIAWSSLPGGGFDARVRAIAPFDDGVETSIVAGGDFTSSGGRPFRSIARLFDPCASCRRGNVNAGIRPVADVLFVNDSAGGTSRSITMSTHDPLTIFMTAPPAAKAPMAFALYAWDG